MESSVWVLTDLLRSVLLLSLWAEPGIKALQSRRVECHHVSSIELAGADPKAPALLSVSPGGATGAPLGAGCEVCHLQQHWDREMLGCRYGT